MTLYRRGFTLVELLIVVVVIGILTTVALPYLRIIQRKAYLSECKTALKNLAYSMELAKDEAPGGRYNTAGVINADSTIKDAALPSWIPQPKVTIRFTELGDSNYAVKAFHASVDTVNNCAMAIGKDNSANNVTCIEP